MSVTDDLKKIIDGVARSGALTPEAIRQFDDLRRRSEVLEEELKVNKECLDSVRSEFHLMEAECGRLRYQVEVVTKRAGAAEANNKEAEKALWIANFEAERRAEMRSILNDVFRNAQIQRTISHSQPMVMPPTYPGGCGTVQYASDTKTETETQI